MLCGMGKTKSWGWGLAAAVVLLARPSTSAPADDGVPSGMVAYFAAGSGCPDGWQPAAEAQGRIAVAIVSSNNVGMRVGTPLVDQEDRTHTHSYTAVASIPSKSVSAADGSNDQAADSGGLGASGTTDEARTGLPFTQLIVCAKP